jgi:Uma2 family endonuclease
MLKSKSLALTYKDYLIYTEHSDRRYELVEGEILMVPSPGFSHQKVVMNLSAILHDFVKKSNMGIVLTAPMDLYVDDTNVLQPDIIFISKEKSYIIEENKINRSPDLVIEIISPSTETRDREIKKKIYAQAEIKEYWIVDPGKKEIEIYTLRDEGYFLSGKYNDKLSSNTFPELVINLSEIF